MACERFESSNPIRQVLHACYIAFIFKCFPQYICVFDSKKLTNFLGSPSHQTRAFSKVTFHLLYMSLICIYFKCCRPYQIMSYLRAGTGFAFLSIYIHPLAQSLKYSKILTCKCVIDCLIYLHDNIMQMTGSKGIKVITLRGYMKTLTKPFIPTYNKITFSP